MVSNLLKNLLQQDKSYRLDIDGLRAIAVLSVIIFHAYPKLLSGGFIGVDVFFVISGFLISSSLFGLLKTQQFSLSEFYLRRIRRLFPSALVVVLATFLFAFLKLSSTEFAFYCKSLVAFISLNSNWFFLNELGYFALDAKRNLLLHTWSLSIEEQFYLIFPLFLLLLHKIKQEKYRLGLILILIILSLTYSMKLTYLGQADKAFFNSFGRFSELLLGCLLAIIIQNNLFKTDFWNKPATHSLLFLGGIGCITLPLFIYNAETLFPGIAVLPPVLGTMCLIFTGNYNCFGNRLLALSPLVYIGRISYGLYLWHWPLLVMVNIRFPNRLIFLNAALVLTGVLSICTYHFVEMPVRKKIRFAGNYPLARAYGLSIICFFTLASVGLVDALRYKRIELIFGKAGLVLDVIHQEGLNYTKKYNLNFDGESGTFNPKKHKGYTCSYDNNNSAERILTCLKAGIKGDTTLIIGDSVGRDSYHALKLAYPKPHFIMLHQSSCMAVDFTNKVDKKCFSGMAELLKPLLKTGHIKSIILSASLFPEEYNKYYETVNFLQEYKIPVLIFAAMPFYLQTIEAYTLKALNRYKHISFSVDKNNLSMVGWDFSLIVKQLQKASKTHLFSVLNIEPFSCNSKTCRLFINNNPYKPIIFDAQHLTPIGIIEFSHFLKNQKQLASFLNRSIS